MGESFPRYFPLVFVLSECVIGAVVPQKNDRRLLGGRVLILSNSSECLIAKRQAKFA